MPSVEATGAQRETPATLVDTHAHLHWSSLVSEVDAVLDRARSAGVQRILTLGTEPESCRAAVRLAECHAMIYAAVGLHPSDIPPDAEGAFDSVTTMLDHPRVVAIGETGLDYYHTDNPPREVQLASFTRHLDLAARTGKPVSIHNRAATSDVLAQLAPYAGRITPILHCFTGDLATARQALDLGCYLSFAGNATYPKLRDVLDVAAVVPAERLLVETDSPFLAPQPTRGRRNEPAHITYTYDAIAALRGLSPMELGELVSRNAQRIFGWAHEDAA